MRGTSLGLPSTGERPRLLPTRHDIGSMQRSAYKIGTVRCEPEGDEVVECYSNGRDARPAARTNACGGLHEYGDRRGAHQGTNDDA